MWKYQLYFIDSNGASRLSFLKILVFIIGFISAYSSHCALKRLLGRDPLCIC